MTSADTQQTQQAQHAQSNVPKIQIVAVVFHALDTVSMKVNPEPSSTKPYFYLDPHGLLVNNLGLVSTNLNGRGENLAIVRVLRVIPIDDTIAAQKVGKPILARFDYDQELIAACGERLKSIKAGTHDFEAQLAIDKALGYNTDGSPNAFRRAALGLPRPRADFGDKPFEDDNLENPFSSKKDFSTVAEEMMESAISKRGARPYRHG